MLEVRMKIKSNETTRNDFSFHHHKFAEKIAAIADKLHKIYAAGKVGYVQIEC